MALTKEDILKEIEPDNFCGPDLRYDSAFIELFNSLKVKGPDQFSGEAAEPINWRNVKKLSEDLLSKTIDLNVLVAYLRALLALEGFSGLDAGLQLIKVAFEQRWEHLHPQLDPEDDNDPFERFNILAEFKDYEVFLKPVQQARLIESRALGIINLRKYNIALGKFTPTGDEGDVSQSLIDGIIHDCLIEDLQENHAHVINGISLLNEISTAFSQRATDNSKPPFTEIINLLAQCNTFLLNALETKGIGNGSEEVLDSPVENSRSIGVAPLTPKSISGTINNDQDVIKTLNLVCEYYKKNEPSSPVPLVIERAIRLVGKSFMDVLKDLAPSGVSELNTISGQREEEQY